MRTVGACRGQKTVSRGGGGGGIYSGNSVGDNRRMMRDGITRRRAPNQSWLLGSRSRAKAPPGGISSLARGLPHGSSQPGRSFPFQPAAPPNTIEIWGCLLLRSRRKMGLKCNPTHHVAQLCTEQTIIHIIHGPNPPTPPVKLTTAKLARPDEEVNLPQSH